MGDLARRDDEGCAVVRYSMVPEELGRIEYCLTDKTGTLTRNEMELKRMHMGVMAYTLETSDEATRHLRANLEGQVAGQHPASAADKHPVSVANEHPVSADRPLGKGHGRARRDMLQHIFDMVESLALRHNVTPAEEEGAGNGASHDAQLAVAVSKPISYQALSSDEVAIEQWTDRVGVVLAERPLNTITLRLDALLAESQYGCGLAPTLTYDVLHAFPFTSESKRVGVVVRSWLMG
ncbi:putative aminophospholipid-translocase [Coemansia spiralis]|nr:putative aminophospholipid-translocase [Coemansia spiralis]